MAGEPVAVSLLAAGVRTLSRSFRFHRPRGLMCSTGQCGWCECAVDGRPSVRTCHVPATAGLDVRGEHAWPSVRWDVFQGLGLGSRWVPPTFYHHRFLRPHRLRKRYLDVIRAFGGRGRLRPGAKRGPASRPRTARDAAPDVLVIGAGRAGLLAALAAAETGARVLVLEARDGGDAGALMAATLDRGVEVLSETVATGWYGGVVTALGPGTAWQLRAAAVVSATGSYESVPRVRGNDLPGVMGARLVRQLIERHRVVPGDRALCVGDGAELEGARVALIGAGARVVGRIPTDELLRIGGRMAVAWAERRGPDGRAQREQVDLVVLGDRTPALDLVLAAGAAVQWQGDHLVPRIDADGATSVPGLWVAMGGSEGDDAARAAGRAAGVAAQGPRRVESRTDGTGPDVSYEAARRPGDPPRSRTARTGVTAAATGADPAAAGTASRGPAHLHDGTVVCFCEDVRAWELRDEVADGYTDPELVKRRTGALTGPCQGKYCLAAVGCVLRGAAPARVPGAGPDLEDPEELPTARPPLRPIPLRDLVLEEASPVLPADAPSRR